MMHLTSMTICIQSQRVRAAKASDIHINVGLPPLFRIHTVVTPSDFPSLPPKARWRWLKQMVNEKRMDGFRRASRCGLFLRDRRRRPLPCQRPLSAQHRRAGDSVPLTTRSAPLEQLFLPEIVNKLTYLPRGLILVTGPDRLGQIHHAGRNGRRDQPPRKRATSSRWKTRSNMRFISNNCAIEQREVGSDVPDFASGLRHVLRQDPDTILVGEMRDLETVSAAITAAETGHLVFSTLHTVNAPQTIERIIDVYPSDSRTRFARCSPTRCRR